MNFPNVMIFHRLKWEEELLSLEIHFFSGLTTLME